MTEEEIRTLKQIYVNIHDALQATYNKDKLYEGYCLKKTIEKIKNLIGESLDE